ncbi:ABC transporter permease [Lutispora thermophila]|uniref:ABC transporter permease n=1 Tax=Lutispora thermophila TaxID=288966 RepID=UPI0038CBF700
MSFLMGVLEQGLLFSIMAFGVYITYKILDFPDLSVDGTFPLGASVTAVLLINGTSPVATCLLSLGAGMAGGFVTGMLHVKFRITNLLSGILVMIGLYSINLRIMGKSNTPFYNERTIFSYNIPSLLVILTLVVIVKVILELLFRTKFGFILKATGDNHNMVTSMGVDIGKIKIIGIMISNGLVALSGSVMAQYQHFSDIGMGSGVIVMGLASIIMGESILKALPVKLRTACPLLGSLLYQGSIATALRIGMDPKDLKLITSMIVIVALAAYNRGLNMKFKNNLRFGGVKTVTHSKSA